MQWTGLNELREKYLSFFESKEHLRLPSYSLVPQGDKSLLLINAGMAPMKKYFTGETVPPSKRVTTCQKCIRTPDIERVGITARHGTYFEMLGNFSFGDYFKKEATAWAWEFFTKVVEIPAELLYCSVYEEDDEAYDIWVKDVGVDSSHVVRMGKEDNFWELVSGPCGPCSEIYFDRGVKHGCGSEDCTVGCDCDRFIEVWNLVFTQFEKDTEGNYTPLQNPNIDTGMGLERLACVMQDVDNLFLVDTIQKIMKHISEIAGVAYGDSEKTDISLRVITDHIRSTTFMIGDGVMPSNEGRGYVLRRLLRRAARHGKLLGINNSFLAQVCETVIAENENAYPELREKQETIIKIINFEEESFYKTIDQGLTILNNFISKADSKVFSGSDAFKLNDTYGFPLDLTKEILEEKGISVDEERFNALLFEQRERARNARKKTETAGWSGDGNGLENIKATEFVGYEKLKSQANILAIVKDGKKVDGATEGEEVFIALDVTPFYAESGGQVGDSGIISTSLGSADIVGTTKNDSGIYIHQAIVTDGLLKSGESAEADVNIIKRRAIMRNHTSAHLLQAALRQVLGNHVEQAGQLVDEKRMRFDFTHFSALTQQEIGAIELIVNKQIVDSVNVECREMTIEKAKEIGAMALFGEKYGDVVRVVSVGDISKEFCGGTHVENASQIGLFKIISESSVAAGVRRIEAVTSFEIMRLINDYTSILKTTAQNLKANNINELPTKSASVVAEMKEKDRQIDVLNSKIANTALENVMNNSIDVCGVNVVSALVSGADSKSLRSMADKVKDISTDKAIVGVIAGVSDGKGTIVAYCSKSAIEKGLKSGNIVKAVAQITGGNGGGKPDFAMAGAKDITKLDEAISQVAKIVAEQMKD